MPVQRPNVITTLHPSVYPVLLPTLAGACSRRGFLWKRQTLSVLRKVPLVLCRVSFRKTWGGGGNLQLVHLHHPYIHT